MLENTINNSGNAPSTSKRLVSDDSVCIFRANMWILPVVYHVAPRTRVSARQLLARVVIATVIFISLVSVHQWCTDTYDYDIISRVSCSADHGQNAHILFI